MKDVQGKVTNSKANTTPAAAPRVKAAPEAPDANNLAEQRVLRRRHDGASFAPDATIGEILPAFFYSEDEHTGMTFPEEALKAISEELYILAFLADPTNERLDAEMNQDRIYHSIMRIHYRALAAAELSARMREAAKAVQS